MNMDDSGTLSRSDEHASPAPGFAWHGAFLSRELESAYEAASWPGYAKRLRMICLVTALAYLGASYGDHFVLGSGPAFFLLLFLRTAAFCVGMAVVPFTHRKKRTPAIDALLAVYMLAVMITESVEPHTHAHKLDTSGPYTLIILLMFYLLAPSRPLVTIPVCLAASAGFLYSSGLAGSGAGDIYMMGVFLLLINVYGAYHLVSVNRGGRREFWAMEQERRMNTRLRQEIAERRRAEERLALLARVDELTGVANRRHFMEQAERELERYRRSGQPVSLLLVDLDHFKRINDTYGHAVGDMTLKAVAATLAKGLRSTDFFGRIGGEEFAAILPATETEAARHIAERLRRLAAHAPVIHNGASIRTTVSIGLAQCQEEDHGVDSLMARADAALYRAKQQGRDRVCGE